MNSGNFPTAKIQRLYQLLTKNEIPFIEADEEEFINAFSGKGVVAGIKWLVKGKNKEISKPSLFYLIEQLEKGGFINDNNNPSFLKEVVLTLFRDENNTPFAPTTLSTSISTYSTSKNNPMRKDEIDKILSKLKP